ncbi:flippase-like domain-containing protein [Paraburkholderia sp. BCC1885]|uniref:flippase-like domain-containing protein n=1 Tax=Paraburkholderia sp. BCC1885 TaxID=2562669 RepID=UPI0011828BB1|nr:flippase-like domain-containing protein [Paraburkholderia sp. BCC1885]
MSRLHVRHAATLLAVLGVGLAMGAPFVLGAHDVLAGLRSVSLQLFAVLAASAALSAAAKAGKLHLMQTALGLRLRFTRTLTLTVVTDFAFLVSPLGAAGYGVNMGLLQRSGASWALATTVVGADQALDLTFFAVAVPFSFLLALGPLTQVTPNFPLPVVLSSLAGLALVASVLWLCRRPAAAALDAAGRRIVWLRARRARWTRFRQSVRQQWGLLLTGARWRLVALLLLTTLQWLLRYSALWFILRELGYRLPLGFVLAVQAVVLHAALWTGVPAGGGGGDLALAATFAPWVPRAAMATALVLWRFATLYCPLLLGAIGFIALAWRRREPAPIAP